MAYKDMNYTKYIIVTVLLYGLEVTLSIFLHDIGDIFGFMSAISISCLAFIFPGLFFLLAERKFASDELKRKNKALRIEAWCLAILGLFMFIFLMTTNIIGLVKGKKK